MDVLMIIRWERLLKRNIKRCIHSSDHIIVKNFYSLKTHLRVKRQATDGEKNVFSLISNKRLMSKYIFKEMQRERHPYGKVIKGAEKAFHKKRVLKWPINILKGTELS